MLVTNEPVQDAAAVLRAKGYSVELCGESPVLWRVDGAPVKLTDSDLLTLAYRVGLAEGPGRTQ